jgi:hypothetical protein
MKKYSLISIIAGVFMSSIFLAACSGGGNGGGGGSPTPTGTSIRSIGTISALGSIFVNGVEYDIQNGVLDTETESHTISGVNDPALKVGMEVEIKGEINDDGITGTAAQIWYKDSLEGPITNITSSGLTKVLDVLGQTVVVENGVTIFDDGVAGFSFDTIAIGDVVEVSGEGDGSATNPIKATYIEKKPAGGVLEIMGVVSNLAGTTFTINSLTVDFTGVTPADGTIANGVLVEVKGTAFAPGPPPELTATSVEIKTPGLTDDVDEAEVEGYLIGLNTTDKTFTVHGQVVNYSSAAFDGGIEADLTNGVKVEAEGSLTGGVLNASKIQFEESIRVEANIAGIAADSLTIAGIDGITFYVDSMLTEFEPPASTLADFGVGNNVKMQAKPTGSSGTSFMLTRLELINTLPDTQVVIQGPVSSINGAMITILGVNIDTAMIPDAEIKDHNIVIPRTTLMNSISAGRLVQVVADISGASPVWIEIELED